MGVREDLGGGAGRGRIEGCISIFLQVGAQRPSPAAQPKESDPWGCCERVRRKRARGSKTKSVSDLGLLTVETLHKGA